jgi:hypothetical protein
MSTGDQTQSASNKGLNLCCLSLHIQVLCEISMISRTWMTRQRIQPLQNKIDMMNLRLLRFLQRNESLQMYRYIEPVSIYCAF